MASPLVLLATFSEVPELTPDDRLLLDELGARGMQARPAIWDDPDVAWDAAALILLRSTWDYHLRAQEFLEWVAAAGRRTRVLNTPTLVAWNSHKFYLRDLEQEGVPIVPTVWLSGGTARAGGSHVDLAQILGERGWPDAILKPAVGASAHGARRVSPDTSAAGQRHLDELLRDGDVMLQPYLADVDRRGETSIVFIAGERTHALRRAAGLKSGRHESVGTSGEATADAEEAELIVPTPEEEALAHRVVRLLSTAGGERPRSVPEAPLYARVDLVRGDSGDPRLLELELIEPALFFRHSRQAVRRMADEVVRLAAHPSGARL